MVLPSSDEEGSHIHSNPDQDILMQSSSNKSDSLSDWYLAQIQRTTTYTPQGTSELMDATLPCDIDIDVTYRLPYSEWVK